MTKQAIDIRCNASVQYALRVKGVIETDALIVDAKETKAPRPRLTAMGYTKADGSPTTVMVRLFGETRWRRVYVIQYSNMGSCFIKLLGDWVFVHPSYSNSGNVYC